MSKRIIKAMAIDGEQYLTQSLVKPFGRTFTHGDIGPQFGRLLRVEEAAMGWAPFNAIVQFVDEDDYPTFALAELVPAS